jgi:hypothetical protein
VEVAILWFWQKVYYNYVRLLCPILSYIMHWKFYRLLSYKLMTTNWCSQCPKIWFGFFCSIAFLSSTITISNLISLQLLVPMYCLSVSFKATFIGGGGAAVTGVWTQCLTFAKQTLPFEPLHHSIPFLMWSASLSYILISTIVLHSSL